MTSGVEQPVPGVGSRKGGHGNTGVVQTMEGAQLPKEMITAARDLNEAIARSQFRDANHLNAVIALARKLIKFGIQDGLDTLLLYVNGLPAIGGYSRIQAIMAHTGIISAEAAGVQLSKRGADDLKEIQKSRSRRNNNDDDQAPG